MAPTGSQGRSAEQEDARRLLGHFDSPAYLRRALAVQDAIETHHRRLLKQREEWLAGIRWRQRSLTEWLRVGRAHSFSTAQVRAIARLSEAILGEVGEPRAPSTSWRPASLYRDLDAAIDRFNGRWNRHVAVFNTDEVNRLIDGYNRHYVFEKECAVGSAVIAARGFVPLERWTRESILRRFPLLPRLESRT